jgi:hypothetical protein
MIFSRSITDHPYLAALWLRAGVLSIVECLEVVSALCSSCPCKNAFMTSRSIGPAASILIWLAAPVLAHADEMGLRSDTADNAVQSSPMSQSKPYITFEAPDLTVVSHATAAAWHGGANAGKALFLATRP